MCGIAGILDWNAPPNMRALSLMTDALAHRGPDAGALHYAPMNNVSNVSVAAIVNIVVRDLHSSPS